MFKLGRWSDKNKIKAVFKLQFHATQVSQFVGDALTISLIPADVGKPTVRLEKAKAREGSCYWEKPIYETVKLTKDPKTGKIHERIYHFVVASGSSKFGVVGEVLLDFAHYAAATKLLTVSLPLKNAKSEAILHVSIQRMADSIDQRDMEGCENAKLEGGDRSLRAHLGNNDADSSIDINSTQDEPFIGKRRESSVSDVTLSSSDSISSLDTPGKLSTKSEEHQEPINDGLKTNYEENQRSHWEWLGSSAPEVSTDGSSSSPQETQAELVARARQADMLELELQTLRKQVVKESKRGDGYLKEIFSLTEERDAFKDENERLRYSFKKKPRSDGGDPWILVEELREEVNYEKDLNANLRLQLRKTQDSNSELILAVQDLEEMLEQKTRSNKSVKYETSDEDEDQRELEELVKDQKPIEESYLLEQKINDLYNEVEICKREKDELEMQMEQLALDYEILKQEHHGISCKLEQSELVDQLKIQCEYSNSHEDLAVLEDRIESLENELKNRTNEFSDALLMIKNLENHVKSLEEELENQANKFERDLEELTRDKIECEKRAIKAEETLRKAREQNSKTAERLQQEFKRLSTQMASTFESNEKVAVKAMNEASSLRLEKQSLQEMLKKAKEDTESVRVFYEAKLAEVCKQMDLKMNQIEQIELEIEVQKKKGEETQRVLEDEVVVHKEEIERLREFESAIILVKKENEKLAKELNGKESKIGHLELEVKNLEVQCNDSKRSLLESETEKERQRKQIFQLKGDLKKKEEAFTSIEKKLKNNKVLEGTKANLKSNKSNLVSYGSKDAANLKERIKSLEGQIKLKETALEMSANSFTEKEKDLHNKIGELERRLEVLSHNSSSFCGAEFEKVARETEELLKEMAKLKEKNKSMEGELKEMQERYSAVSLKFAEVEGERQQLVMTLRNLKNPKKV